MHRGRRLGPLGKGEPDPRFGKVMNAKLAEYPVPSCADVGELDVNLVSSSHTSFDRFGMKRLAQVATCGPAPAITNALHHATGRRIRELPIAPDRRLG